MDLAVACDVYDGVFFVLSFFPRGVLDEILNLIESVSEGFLPTVTYRISHVPNPSPPSVSVFRASKLELILRTFHVPSSPSFCMTCKHVSQGSLPLVSRPSVLGNPLGPCLFLAHKIGPLF